MGAPRAQPDKQRLARPIGPRRRTPDNFAHSIAHRRNDRPKAGRLARLRARRDLASLDFLAEEGCLYVADWVNDDQPYFMDLGGKRLVSIPYSYEINDSLHFQNRNGTIDEFERMIRRQFDTLYAEGAQSGRVMAICLHPYL